MVRRAVGLSIGFIATDLLDPIYKQHPEIEDLNE